MMTATIQAAGARRPGLRLCTLALAFVTVSAVAQGRGPGGPPPGGGQGGPGGGMNGGGMNSPMVGGFNHVTPVSPTSNTETSAHTGLQLGPPGRWWDNKSFAKTIGLNSLQQHRMDDVFNANRDTLMKLLKTLQHEESQLEKISRSRELDENLIFQQIDRVMQARGEVEKATAHTLLQIRKEMTPDQTAKLDELRPAPSQ